MATALILGEMMKIQWTQTIFAVSLIGIASSAFATISYSDEAAFTAGVGGAPIAMESFESITGGNGTSLAFPTVDVSCDGGAWCSSFFGVSPILPTDGSQGVFFATPDSITFTFATPITAFAIDVGDLGTQGPTDFSATLSNGNEITFLSGYSGSSFDQLFIGLIDNIEFTSITFHGSMPDDGIYFDRMQTALAIPVPEPEIYVMLLAGLGFLGIVSRRRKQMVSIE